MFDKFNKRILYLLIIPVFCELLFMTLGTIFNGWEVKWINILIFFIVLVVSAAAMSKNGSMVINTMGFLMFSSVGVFFIITYFDLPARVRSAYPKGELYFGISIVVLATIIYAYKIMKNTEMDKKRRNLIYRLIIYFSVFIVFVPIAWFIGRFNAIYLGLNIDYILLIIFICLFGMIIFLENKFIK